eukprot:GSChrysophyteH1.ASY1.ANO1.2055.1 assembled CDS
MLANRIFVASRRVTATSARRLLRSSSSLSLSDEIAMKSHEVLRLGVEKANAERQLLALKSRLHAGGSRGAAQDSTNIERQELELGPSIDYYSVETTDTLEFGDYEMMRSQAEGKVRSYVKGSDLQLDVPGDIEPGQTVWLRGRVSNIRAKGNSIFIVLRTDPFTTVQACHFKGSSDVQTSLDLLKFGANIPLESIIDVCGTVAAADVKSCTQSTAEIHLKKLFTQCDLIQDIRLNSRWLDLRVPANNAIIQALVDQGFTEINTPKLIGGESEGGANAFKLDYFGRDACLAQSPQLYKQMAIAADLDKVFEIGPVFRAENSNTRRHLCEFTGLDMEMAINSHYNEALEVVHKTFRHIFDGLEKRFANELGVIRRQFPSEPVTFTEKPCETVDIYDDLTTALELKLGALSPHNPLFTNSYDMFIRGQEICSGAQRCHDPQMLREQIEEQGMNEGTLKHYVESFTHGISPHAGAGIGLDRVVFLYLGLDNVRKGTMFPRDPSRIAP